MKSAQSNDMVVLYLEKEEAIVMFEWICRFNKARNVNLFQDQAEERVLWDVEASLEKIMPEILERGYAEILAKAREKVRDQER